MSANRLLRRLCRWGAPVTISEYPGVDANRSAIARSPVPPLKVALSAHLIQTEPTRVTA
jgi:hypothetical protein